MSVTTISAPLASPPQQFTNVNTLINGQANVIGVMLFRDGILMTEGLDYTRDGGKVTMTTPPTGNDILTARVFAIGRNLGGPGPTRYIAPWTLRLAGAFDGVSTSYQIVFGPTIAGICDGVNPTFTWQVWVQRGQVWRNGILQTQGIDIAWAPTAVKFLPNAIPQAGDIITMLAYWE